jgi:hypothetical protein
MLQSLAWKAGSNSGGQEMPCFYGTQRFIVYTVLNPIQDRKWYTECSRAVCASPLTKQIVIKYTILNSPLGMLALYREFPSNCDWKAELKKPSPLPLEEDKTT